MILPYCLGEVDIYHWLTPKLVVHPPPSPIKGIPICIILKLIIVLDVLKRF